MFKKSKKATAGIFISTIILVVVWIFSFIIVDYVSLIGDKLINETWEKLDENATYYDSYGTFQTNQTNMKRIVFYIGLVFIPMAGLAAAYAQKVNQYRR